MGTSSLSWSKAELTVCILFLSLLLAAILFTRVALVPPPFPLSAVALSSSDLELSPPSELQLPGLLAEEATEQSAGG